MVEAALFEEILASDNADVAPHPSAIITRLPVPYQPHCSLDETIELWLNAKTGRSGSQNTRRNYHDQICWFRERLQAKGLDLDDPDTILLAQEAQAWAIRDNPAQSTYNHRLSTIASFYKYARKNRLLMVENPIDFFDRAVVPAYPNVQPLDIAVVHQRLLAIDTSTLRGKRDLALLVVALYTGRRRAELVKLRMGDIEWGRQRVTLIWRRCKGGKVMRDTLHALPQQILLDYLHTLYGPNLSLVPKTAGVWVSMAPWNQGKPLCSTAIFRICKKHLGITSVHLLRHTFAHAMEAAGAKVSDIQASLGHSNLATTSTYLAALRREENPCGDALAALFGLADLTTAVVEPVERQCLWCGNSLDKFAQSDPNRRYCSKACGKAAEREKRQHPVSSSN